MPDAIARHDVKRAQPAADPARERVELAISDLPVPVFDGDLVGPSLGGALQIRVKGRHGRRHYFLELISCSIAAREPMCSSSSS
jgi:hypothetical protein